MKIGLIGFGHLAKAFARGLINDNPAMAEKLAMADINEDAKADAAESFGIRVFPNNADLAKASDLIILAVKPNTYKEVLDEIGPVLEDRILASFLAGTGFDKLSKEVAEGSKIIRVMPNIAMEIGESLTAICPNAHVSEGELAQVKEVFDKVGLAVVTDEEDLERISVISGSGLGYVAQIIDSMSKASVSIGYSGNADEAVTQVFLAGAKLLEKSNMTPEAMAKAVATEGGTTIEGIKVMQERGLDQLFSDAAGATYAKVQKFKA